MNLSWLTLLRRQHCPDFLIPTLQAHRGYWIKGHQENTLSAFQEAMSLGYKMIEFDVQLSKDEIPVVFHDQDLRRLGADPSSVEDLTAAELKEKVFAPSLEEVLLSKNIPEFLNIEIKSKFPGSGLLEKRISDLVTRISPIPHQIQFSSFNPLSLFRMQSLLPHIPRALLAAPDEQYLWLSFLLSVYGVNLSYKNIDQDLILKLKDKGLALSVWTLNDSNQGQELLDRGVRSLISDSITPQDLRN